jgi:hypothetical protein
VLARITKSTAVLTKLKPNLVIQKQPNQLQNQTNAIPGYNIFVCLSWTLTVDIKRKITDLTRL